MKKHFLTVLFCFIALVAGAQVQRPKLVVGIIIDQMRWDYLTYYYNQFGEGGFKRLMNEGFSCDNQMINYLPTVTAIGHSSNYTGSVPALHGITGNDFYINGKKVSSCEDHSVKNVGSEGSVGERSPHNLLATTIGDELKMATDFKSKVIGVSIKDRASILPAGHCADAAYWYDQKTGRFITSSYYMDKLPNWMIAFNKNSKIKPGTNLIMLPEGATQTFSLAEAAVKNEQMGKDEVTDMLCVSISSTDAIGHAVGTRGEDNYNVYMQTDKALAHFLTTLDQEVGKGNYLVVLTADHGGAHNPNLMKAHGVPADGWDSAAEMKRVEERLAKKFGVEGKYILDTSGFYIYVNRDFVKANNLDFQAVKDAIVDILKENDELAFVVDLDKAATTSMPEVLREMTINGYYRTRTGQIMVITNPQVFSWKVGPDYKGTTHGAWNPYDAHIPLLFMGWHIGHGSTKQRTHITDMAPTVCALLNIQQPNACIGTPIMPVIESQK